MALGDNRRGGGGAMTFKRGIVVPTPQAEAPKPQVIGRQLSVRQTTIVSPSQTTSQPQGRVIARPELGSQRPGEYVRGLLVDGTGKPLRGLSQATIQAHKAQTEDATEQCMNCGKMVPPAQMKTVIANAYNSNNPLRLCNTPDVPGEPPSCVKLAYKDPHKVEARQIEPWRPSIPAVRFDRETAAPYDARERGVSISELVTRDTYHNEREVESKYKTDVLVGEGRWSGGGRAGHQVTSETVSQSRERASRARR